MKQIIIVFILVLLSSTVNAGPPIFTSSIEDAKEISTDLKLPILTIVSADWCLYCKKLDKTLSDNLNKFDNIIILKLDYDKHESFVKENEIKKIPTIIYNAQKYVGIYDIKDLEKIIAK